MRAIEIIGGILIVLVGGYFLTMIPAPLLMAQGVASVVILGVPVVAYFVGKFFGINFRYNTPMKLFMTGTVALFAAFVIGVGLSFADVDVTQPPIMYIFVAFAFGGFVLVCAAIFTRSAQRTFVKALVVTFILFASPAFAGGGGGGEMDIGGCILILLYLAVIGVVAWLGIWMMKKTGYFKDFNDPRNRR